jgi:hypothetical protein
MSTGETTSRDTRLRSGLPYDYHWYGLGLHASLPLEVFRSESRDDILLRGEGCNTPGVYIPLDNEYGFKHVISVEKRTLNFKHLSSIAILISHLFRLSRVRRRFYFYLSGLFLNFHDVRNIVIPKIGASDDYLKIHRSRESEFGSPTQSNDFIPDKFIWTRRLKYSGRNNWNHASSEWNRARE